MGALSGKLDVKNLFNHDESSEREESKSIAYNAKGAKWLSVNMGALSGEFNFLENFKIIEVKKFKLSEQLKVFFKDEKLIDDDYIKVIEDIQKQCFQ